MSVEETAPHSHVITTVTNDGNPNNVVTQSGGSDSGALPQNEKMWVKSNGKTLQSRVTGGDKPHNNISPSISGYMWTRTA